MIWIPFFKSVLNLFLILNNVMSYSIVCLQSKTRSDFKLFKVKFQPVIEMENNVCFGFHGFVVRNLNSGSAGEVSVPLVNKKCPTLGAYVWSL